MLAFGAGVGLALHCIHMTQTRALFFLVAAVVVIGLFTSTGVFMSTPTASVALLLEPTTFVEVGTLKAVPTGSQDSLIFMYGGAEGAPQTEMALLIDAETICVQQSGTLPCMAMSTLYGTFFEGKTVVVEGVEKDLRLRVKTIRVVPEADLENPFVPPVGISYIPWPKAKEIIESCQAASVDRTEDLAVHVLLKDGRGVLSFEPVADDVVKILEGSSCYRDATTEAK